MRSFFKLVLVLIVSALTGVLLFYLLAIITPLKLDDKKEQLTIYDINDNILYETNFKKELHWTPIEEIPTFVQEALVSVEDKRFYQHYGFDSLRIAKAVYNNLKAGQIVEGGSTISQQMAKNLFLTQEQTLKRKIEELFYAARMETQYDKAAILEGYLNTLYYGHGVYGIKQAADFFFALPLEALDTAQLAMLIAIPNGPALYSPLINEANAKKRQELILDIFYKNELISIDELQSAKKEVLTYNTEYDDSTIDDYYIQAVLDELYNMKLDLSSGARVFTYYDPFVSKQLHESFKQHCDQSSELETSAMITQPFTGNILAIKGGKDYTVSQFNRAYYAKRQAASTIKPLLYYLALDSGFTPATHFLSAPTSFQIDEDNLYSPTNYNSLYPNKEISMINAIAMSDNIYAVKTHLFLGTDSLNQALLDFGFDQSLPNPSLALGTIDLSLFDLTLIYNTFASNGLFIQPSTIAAVSTHQGNILYERDMQLKRLMKLDETLIINQMLTATFDLRNKTINFPTMYGSEPKVITGAKSGTSLADSLVIGFNPDYTLAVWSGFDDNRLLDKEFYNVSKKIYQDTFNRLYADSEIAPWYQPTDHLVKKIVDPITGEPSLIGSVYWFKKEENQLLR